MSRKKVITFVILGALVAALGVGAVTISKASAMVGSTTTWNQTDRMGKGPGWGVGQNDEALAQALGISTSELDAARQKAKEAALAQAVEKGLITQTQADQLQNNQFAFPFGGRWADWLSQNGIDFNALLADALGISTDELQAARQKAMDIEIDQALQEGKLTQEQADLIKARRALANNSDFISAMKTAFQNAVQAAVKSGVITQAQADALLKNLEQNGWRGMGGLDGAMPSLGGFGGRHHPGGGARFGGLPGVPPVTPTVTP
ncbi:MAG: hypothetical protein ACPL4H_05675 [Anaerolineales bacterium]